MSDSASCSITYSKTRNDHIERNLVYQITNNGPDLIALEIWANLLNMYTAAAITHIAVTYGNDLEGQEGSSAYGAVDLEARLFFRGTEDNKLYCVPIPAPLEILLDENQEVLPEPGAAIAAGFTALTGIAVEFTHGALCGSSGDVP